MNETIKDIWERNGSWVKTRQEIKSVLGIKITQQEVYDIVNDIQDSDRVAPCGKIKTFSRWDRGYQFCGNNCECSKTQSLESREATNLERYGSKNPMGNPEIQKRFKQSMMAAHGVESALKSPKSMEKLRQTTLKNYGVTNASQSPIVREKAQKTLLDRFGVDNAMKNAEIRSKAQATMTDRYGAAHTMSSPVLREKVKNTILERYDRDHHTQKHIDKETIALLSDKTRLEEYMRTRSLNVAAKELGIYPGTVIRYWASHDLPPLPTGSSFELEIKTFLESLEVEFIRNTRSKIGTLELDFYLPDYNLAIEFNGIYWHTSNVVDKNYHRRKYEACRDNGIRLLMINEDEWVLSTEAWKSRITHLLNKSPRGLPARKLVMRRIDQKLLNDFCDIHHIQGKPNAVIYGLGAFSGEELVGVMAFNNQRGTGDIELVRFCTDEYSHAGLFSKMFKHSIMEMKFSSVLSFADLRHSDGAVYHRNGFTLASEIPPDYRYVLRDKTYHKSAFTKKRIAQRFGLDMSIMTEKQAMESLDIPRIYDCGKLKFVWTSS